MRTGAIRLVLLLLVLALTSVQATAQSVVVSREWYWAIFGHSIGAGGMVAADLDGNGSVELVVSAWGWGGYWYVAEYDGSDYVQRWTSLPLDFEISRLVVAQMDTDPALEILVASNYDLLVYDGVSFQLQAQHVTGVERARGLAVANVDGDPAFEAAICDLDGTSIFDLETGVEQLSLPTYPCLDLAIGETDGSPGLELVIADGDNPGVVLDAATGAEEWVHPTSFGRDLVLGDLDGDTLDEIVAAFSSSTGLEVWHGDSRLRAWNVPDAWADAVTIADVEGDGPLEVIYGESQWGGIYVLDGVTGGENWSVGNPYHGTGRIGVGDVDGDGVKEIAFAPTNNGRLQIVDSSSRLIEWTSADLTGPFGGLGQGDVDADGTPELVFASAYSDNGYGDSRYLIVDAATKALEYISPEQNESSWDRTALAVSDIDADPQAELILPTADGYRGVLKIRDGLSHEIQWQHPMTLTEPFTATRVADLDGDGVPEVVSTFADNYIMVHEGPTGALEWQSFNLGSFMGYMRLMRVADVDDDGIVEVLVASSGNGNLMAIDPVAATIDLSADDLQVTALDAVDLDGDLIEEIIIGTEDGWVRRVDPVTAAVTDLVGPFPGEIYGLDVEEVTGDSVLDYVFAADDRVYLVDGATGLAEWISEDLGHEVGIDDSLLVDDIDADGRIEIWVNVGVVGHMVFAIYSGDPVFFDDFESRNTSRWSVTVP